MGQKGYSERHQGEAGIGGGIRTGTGLGWDWDWDNAWDWVWDRAGAWDWDWSWGHVCAKVVCASGIGRTLGLGVYAGVYKDVFL